MTTFNACLGSEPTKPPEDHDIRLLKIKKLKAKLINEEHRLVLMKKIRQSQTRPIAQQQQQQQTPNHLTGANIVNNASMPSSTTQSASGHLKKLRSPHQGPLSLQKNQSLGSSATSIQSLHNSLSSASSTTPGVANLTSSTSSLSSPSGATSMNQTPAHAHQRPKVNTLWNPPQQARHPTPVGIAPPHVGNLSRQPITTPPNVVQAMMGNLAGQQSLLMNQINPSSARRPQQQSQQQSSSSSSSFNKAQAAAQMLLQKRPTFKPSIQKQLEQTLMQQQAQKHVQPGQGFSPNLNKRAVGITSPHVGNLSRQPITTPPNVVQDMRGGLSGAGQQSLLMNANNLSAASRRPQLSQQQQPLQQQQQSSFNKSQAAQMLLQKRTAAKSAIQKQLEQTLMQLPTKHVQLGIDFVPNANNIEFVYYVGLEVCVDYLTGTKNPLDTQPLEKPFECSTCGTDFTPTWSWKRSNVVCENCVGNHVKKSIKNSQANRIKSVLSKAAKQEQDMDQRIMAEAANVVSIPSTPTTSTSQQHSLLQPVSHQQQPQQQRSTNNQSWPRINSVGNSNRGVGSTNVQPTVSSAAAAAAANPLAAVQPALASILMNPQLSTLASLMNPNQNNSNNNNQFAQVAALLMNQLTMNMWKR